MIGRDEINKMKSERNLVFIALLFASAMILIAALLIWKGQITGYQALDTFESDVFVTGSSPDGGLSFERIPNFRADAGDHIRFRVAPNKDGVRFSDDTSLFEIDQEGTVEFIPSAQDIGKHNVWIIIKDDAGNYYYQNVIIIVEEI